MSSQDRTERGFPDPGGLSILNDIALPAGVMAAAVLLVFPGLFDATYNSRLVLYPLLGALLILAGRHRLSVNHLCVLAGLTVVPVVSIIWLEVLRYINSTRDVIPQERYPELYRILDTAEQSPNTVVKADAARTRMILDSHAYRLQWTPE